MSEPSTYIKLDRNILTWGWYTDANTVRLFIHIILKANIKECKFLGVAVKRGQLVTSYPSLAKELNLQGRVTMQFTVMKDGSVGNIKVVRGVDPLLDQEALRVVATSPKWEPGRQRERAVNVTYTFPVIFRLR